MAFSPISKRNNRTRKDSLSVFEALEQMVYSKIPSIANGKFDPVRSSAPPLEQARQGSAIPVRRQAPPRQLPPSRIPLPSRNPSALAQQPKVAPKRAPATRVQTASTTQPARRRGRSAGPKILTLENFVPAYLKHNAGKHITGRVKATGPVCGKKPRRPVRPDGRPIWRY